jgi:hypothetical protein
VLVVYLFYEYLGVETIYFDSQLPLGPQLEKVQKQGEKSDEDLLKEAVEPPYEILKSVTNALRENLVHYLNYKY